MKINYTSKVKLYLTFYNSLFLINCNSESQENNSSKNNDSIVSMKNITAPSCEKIPHEMTIHNHTRVDNYFWLNDRENPKTIDYLNAENDYTNVLLNEPTKKLQKDLFDELKARIKEDDQSVPYFKNGYYYQTKYEEGGEYPIYTRATKSDFSDVEIILDGNEMGKDFEYFDISGFEISPDNKLMAFATDTVSRRLYNIQIKDLTTGTILSDFIPNSDGGFAWAEDNQTLFYSQQDPETLRSDQIKKHTLGKNTSDDESIFFEKDETYNCYVYKSKSDKYIIIGSSSTLTDEYQILESNKPNGTFKVFQKRTKGLEYSISHYKDQFYILTNKDNATNFQVMQCSETTTDVKNWKPFIPHRAATLIENFSIFENHLVISERTNGLSQIRIINPKTKADYYLPFNDETYVAYVSGNPNFETNKLRYWYSSLTTPGTTFEFDMNTQEQTILKQQEVQGSFKSEDYISKRVFATARDGVQVPISIVYHKNTLLNGSAPLLQYAYGSYGSSSDPYFSSSRLSLLDRGFIFAITHIRGGEEMGRQWYEDGKLLKKWNTFYDFIDCSKFLIENKYTHSEKLFAMGGSAGGLLMGVIVNENPELYKGVIAAVPFVDVMTTMLDASIPLTTGEYDEWGNPNEKEYYDYMLSYSPYDQVKAQNYPNMLVTTGLHDSQVQYWEPAKWVAKLRELKTDDNLLLLHTNMSAGHGGASGRFEYLKEVAMEYAFMLMLLD